MAVSVAGVVQISGSLENLIYLSERMSENAGL